MGEGLKTDSLKPHILKHHMPEHPIKDAVHLGDGGAVGQRGGGRSVRGGTVGEWGM